MKLTRKNARSNAISLFKATATCRLSRNLCQIIRLNRAVLTKDDVSEFCTFISDLCLEHGCEKQHKSCRDACKKLDKGDEEGYLKKCLQSCKTCGKPSREESVQPRTMTYVS